MEKVEINGVSYFKLVINMLGEPIYRKKIAERQEIEKALQESLIYKTSFLFAMISLLVSFLLLTFGLIFRKIGQLYVLAVVSFPFFLFSFVVFCSFVKQKRRYNYYSSKLKEIIQTPFEYGIEKVNPSFSAERCYEIAADLYVFNKTRNEYRTEIKNVRKNAPLFPYLIDFNSLSGTEFEDFCCKLLSANGFSNISKTSITGDQGVDIIARKQNDIYAFQCKRYSGSLGNSPIQEVYAGSKIYGANKCAVITNASFTKGAFELAYATGVELWGIAIINEMIDAANKNNMIDATEEVRIYSDNNPLRVKECLNEFYSKREEEKDSYTYKYVINKMNTEQIANYSMIYGHRTGVARFKNDYVPTCFYK